MTEFSEHRFEFGGSTTFVKVGSGSLASVGRWATETGAFPKALVVTDDTVGALYGDRVLDSLNASGITASTATVAPGDVSKSIEVADRLYGELAAAGIGRDGVVVAVGGGVVSDLAGFVAATWMRGIATVLCPTTLEADVDAAIGGKVGINHRAGKNLIGAFHHPKLVVADTDCLGTLHDRDLAAGMAESIKHGLIGDASFVAWHESSIEAIHSRDADVLTELVDRNIRIKADVVTRDERETSDIRIMLNFGHTIGHAIEAAAKYSLRHGECVSLGMVAACRISRDLGMLANDDCDRVERMLEAYRLPVRLSERFDSDEIRSLIAHDKKARTGIVRFVLLDGIGNAVVRSDVGEDLIQSALASLQPD